MPPGTPVYEERYRWTRTSVTALALCSALVPVAVALARLLPLRVVIIVCCAYGAFLSIIVSATRRVALRVDAAGITPGGGPLRYKATTRLVPLARGAGRVLVAARARRPLPIRRTERPADAPAS